MSSNKNKSTNPKAQGGSKNNKGQNIPSESRKANPDTDTHTKKRFETPQFIERDRSANERTEQNKK